MKRLSAASARAILAAIWAASFLINLTIALCLYLNHDIGDDNFEKLTTTLNSSYVTYLAAVIGCYVIVYTKKPKTSLNPGLFVVALVSSLLWNGVLSAFVWPLIFERGTVEGAIKYIGYFAPLLSWIVAPIFTVFFVKNATE
ncbi:hypothetical protein [Terriglobus roseus]|uniref:Uncharacterized protein n=1 Tax=Terriglobus roseus TaxID=392734 RepID=A0A1G7GBN5_9BACT|nr:hypothetical protein [Terriglobus roseus]SDE85536.1 hypothetical protein SAMN05444167_0639 [Terriglobus roseus]